jgi:uracil-DNA glycosylase
LESYPVQIAIVGEAWGAEEDAQKVPFVGASGWQLTQMLTEAGIHRAHCFLTNCFNLRPPGGNDVENLCTDKASGLVGLGPIKPGKYLRPEYAPELDRLARELTECEPNVIIALGGTACWALLGTTGITKLRGTVVQTTRIGAWKCLPTFHPAAVLRDWSLRPVTVLDLAKAGREAAFPEIRRPERVVYIEPTLEDLDAYFEAELVHAPVISFDIETSGDQITCVGFAAGSGSAIVCPFRDNRQRDGEGRVGSYWPTAEAEILAWQFVRRVLSLPQPKVAQNGLYDINFLWTRYGIPVVNYEDDTMLLHHSLQPESQKGLGFLGSVYTNESSWKLLNRRDPTVKREK